MSQRAIAFGILGALANLGAAQSGTFIPVPEVPGSTYTAVTAINNSNTIAGWYSTPDSNVHGFFGTLDGQYQTFDYPTGHTTPLAISDDGYISGEANPTDGRIGDEFIRSPSGKITTVTRDGVGLDGQAHGFGKHDMFVGDYWTFDENGIGTDHGYLGRKGKWDIDIVLPVDTSHTAARDIDNHGRIVGHFGDPEAGGLNHGFVLDGSDMQVVAYPDANATFTLLEGMNDRGVAVGYWGGNTVIARSFVFDIASQKFKSIRVSGSTYAYASSINNAGLVALSSDVGSFIYCTKKRTCPTNANAITVADKRTTPSGRTP